MHKQLCLSSACRRHLVSGRTDVSTLPREMPVCSTAGPASLILQQCHCGTGIMAQADNEYDLECPILNCPYAASGNNLPVVACENVHVMSKEAVRQV